MAMQKTMKGSVVAIAVATILMITSVMAVKPANKSVSNAGGVKGIDVGIYQDCNCSSSLASIEWGLLEPGGSANRTIYIKNEGNIEMVLNMTTSTWTPFNAQSYMTLTWNCEGTSVASGNYVQALLTLTVLANATSIDEFNFIATIVGTS
jgi:hypothetical protein